ncbi:exodeoxyribonuclease V subunit gamma [Buchnera aphidicola]|uniref:exodeoxyribonuclease V subunit gamma n=1 Tax=Buchnera aphidicola TaxID=9 RepID=UPI0034642C74
MFIIYKSNQLHILFSKICQIIKKKPKNNIFQKEIFVYDNKILLQWLHIFIAEKQGISENFQFYYTDHFIWKLFQIFVTDKNTINIYKKSIMTWNIMKIIEKKNYSNHVNTNDHPIKKFKFSLIMADIFEQYLIYRPTWINIWEEYKDILKIEKNEEWQKIIWQNLHCLVKKKYPSQLHYANIFHIINSIQEKKNIINVPKRCFIMSSFSLTSTYIKILETLGKYINIYLLHVTSCKKNIFYYQVKKNKNILFNKKKHIQDDSLIMLWGKYEKIYSLYINSKTIKIINCFKITKAVKLLNIIQNDILITYKKKNKNHSIYDKKILYTNDDSISVNVCHDKKHEITILYKKILNIFKKNPSILPGDIIVVSNTIHEYIDFINSIFTSQKNKYKIPFFIGIKNSKRKNIILSTFITILNLPNTRCSNKEILELLEIPEIANKFNISEDEIEILYSWVQNINIRWGIDEKHQNHLLKIKNKKSTWLYGIKKLLLSYSINEKNSIWNNILSPLSINSSQSELIGKIAHFIFILNKWRVKLSQPKKFKSWYKLSQYLINDFFQNNILIQKTLDTIQNNWENMIHDGMLSEYKKKISINILKICFTNRINSILNKKKFLPGVINFCHPKSTHNIPFKVIYIIGANEEDIPRKQKILPFNLLHCHPYIGDKNIHIEDSYLFLQILSSAKKYFYISYARYSIQYNIARYPSILIQQLMDYISSHFCFIGDEKISNAENKKKIFNYFYQYHEYQYSYPIQNIRKKNNIIHLKNTFKKEILKINYKDLIDFWKNPILYFFKKKFKIQSIFKNKEILTNENFFLNKFNCLQFNTILLNKIIHNEDIETWLKQYELSGILPYKYFGKIFLTKQKNAMLKIANLVSQFRINTVETEINLKIKKYEIYGILSEVQDTGLLRWKPNIINYNDKISLWIEHLLYCVLGGSEDSRIISYKNHIWSLSALQSDIASEYLLRYIIGYQKGIYKPVFLLKSGIMWLNYIFDTFKNCITRDKIKKKKGYLILLKNWHGDNYFIGEKENLYIKSIIPELNPKNIQKIYATTQKWLLPILKNQKK